MESRAKKGQGEETEGITPLPPIPDTPLDLCVMSAAPAAGYLQSRSMVSMVLSWCNVDQDMATASLLAFHDTDTDFLVRILADTSDTRDFLKLFLWQDERHADILAKILARMSARMSVSDGVGVGVVECELIGLRP